VSLTNCRARVWGAPRRRPKAATDSRMLSLFCTVHSVLLTVVSSVSAIESVIFESAQLHWPSGMTSPVSRSLNVTVSSPCLTTVQSFRTGGPAGPVCFVFLGPVLHEPSRFCQRRKRRNAWSTGSTSRVQLLRRTYTGMLSTADTLRPQLSSNQSMTSVEQASKEGFKTIRVTAS
jgi:hypothetical protein